MVTDPQYKYYDTQTIFSVDIDDLYNRFIVPIDNQRSHFNALVLNSQELNTPQYQESRCHAFYRMIGFPVVARSGSFYSPGYDPNLNLNPDTLNSYKQIASNASSDSQFLASSSARELQEQKIYDPIWATQNISATAIAIGSIFLRAFDKQFSDDSSIGPLDYDISQKQTVDARTSEINRFFGNSSTTYPSQLSNINLSLLTSTHFIKPFVVDPRIDNSCRPVVNRIASPFLNDKSQLKIFDPQTGTPYMVLRPYIELVISTRFNNANISQTAPQPYIDSVVNFIKSSDSITDQDLINAVSNPNSQLHTSELAVFSNYLKIIRALIKTLHDSIIRVEEIRKNINFQPVPNPNRGIEAGSENAAISATTPGDPNNLQPELDIALLQQKKALDEVIYDIGLAIGVPDPGNFAFSNVEDIVFDANKNTKSSYDTQTNTLLNYRNALGDEGLDNLKKIEIIVGEFSGLGLLDIMAIQAALWIVDPAVLVGLIDSRAQARMQLRKDITPPSPNSNIINCLTEFEAIVKQIYKLIGSYIQVLEVQGNFTDVGT
jgi:hypothetical protein